MVVARTFTDESDGGRARPRRAGVIVLALGVLVLKLLVLSPSALALSQRGHVPGASFGSAGSGDGQFSGPAGVALGEASGDIYVVDRGNNRVERFDGEGNFISAWGWGVSDGAKVYEICTERCQAGVPGSGKGASEFHIGNGQFSSPEAIAVDNSPRIRPLGEEEDRSSGDVYVVSSVVPEKSYLQKYGPAGEYLGRVTKRTETESFGRIDGVSVDAEGVVWVDWSEGKITSYNDAEPNRRVDKEEEISSGLESVATLRPGFAVDARDDLYVNYEPGEPFAEAGEGAFSEEGRDEAGEQPCEGSPCYVAKLAGLREPGTVLTERLERANTSAIATDLGDEDVYLDNRSSVAVYDAAGSLIQHVGSGDIGKGQGLAVRTNDGALYVADAATDSVQSFIPEPVAAPLIDEISAAKIDSSSAELTAEVDPRGGAAAVTFQYGTASCAAGSCVSMLAGSVGVPGETPGDFEDHPLAVDLSELSASTEYHYRVLVTRGSEEVLSEHEGVFTTQSGQPFALLDGRAWEQVSPPAKNGAGFEAISKEGGLIQASEDGDAITYLASGPDEAGAEGNRSPEYTQILSSRVTSSAGQSEWLSQDINTPNDIATGIEAGKAPEYQYFSPDLSLALLRPKGPEPALSSEASEVTPYLRENARCGPVPSACYKPLVTGKAGYANVPPGTKFGGSISRGVQLLDAEPNLEHVVLQSEVPLTGEHAAAGPNLYEWSEGSLRLINTEPEGAGPAVNAKLGSDNYDVRHALADNGTRVFWTGVTDSPLEGFQRLYLRDTAREETIRLDLPQEGVKAQTAEGAGFGAANSEGSRVFFTDVEPLTPGARASREPVSPDLYACDIVEQAGKLACELHDLTADTNPGGERADVQGTILGEAEDGSSIYFVANGVLDNTANAEGEKATPGECEPNGKATEGTCNLYVEHDHAGTWEAPTFIASLANADEPDWYSSAVVGAGGLAEVTSRVSPNGRYLAFMSDRGLTGYDNRDVNSGARDEEVFVYDTSTGRLVCASCDPSGGRPAGVFDNPQSSVEGIGLLVDRPQTWAERWLAGSVPGWTPSSENRSTYQSRYLSDTGRLFFDSADSLVPADTNGKEDVYEYEPNGLAGCASVPGCVGLVSSGSSEQESAFLDASASGDDVFFLTAAPLLSSDTDSNFDVYDARVCQPEGCVTPSPPAASNCQEAETCRAAAPSEPVYAAPATTAPSAAGDLPAARPLVTPVTIAKPALPTRAQRLARALKSCRKLKHRKKRLACEAQARRRYGPASGHRASLKAGARRS
jgi:NHL repeat